MKTETEIRSCLLELQNKSLKEGPYTEWERIALEASKQALEWVIERKEKPLTF